MVVDLPEGRLLHFVTLTDMAEQDLQIKVAIASRFENIDLVDAVMEASMRHFGFDEETVERLGLAIREAVANGMRHGNKQDPTKKVELCCDLKQDVMALRITDEGSGFDVDAVPDPLATDNLFNSSGRGILLMRAFMDEVDFKFDSRGATQVTLKKRLPSSASDSGSKEVES